MPQKGNFDNAKYVDGIEVLAYSDSENRSRFDKRSVLNGRDKEGTTMTVITISHEIGSGGREIGQAVAVRLGYDYVDKQVVQQAAQRLGISEQTATRLDERAQSTVDRLLASLSVGTQLMIAPPEGMEITPNDQEYFDATQKVVEAAVSARNVVIAGHGANFALYGKPDVFSVFIHRPKAQRIAVVMQRDGISHDEAAKQVTQNDQQRAHYVKTFYHHHWHDASHYQLAIDTNVISLPHAVDLIVRVLQESAVGRVAAQA